MKLKNRLYILKQVEKNWLRDDIPNIDIGDTVRIGILIQEGNKERVQFADGVIIAIHKSSLKTTITVRKVLQGVGLERIYLIYSPRIIDIKITKKSKIRRAKLYYLRKRSGKATRLKQKF